MSDWIRKYANGMPKAEEIYRRLAADRIIFIGVPIDDNCASSVRIGLREFASKDWIAPISIFVNSPGGSVTAGLSLLQAMEELGVAIATHCVGQAAAMAAMVVAHGTRGQRMAMKNSTFHLLPLRGDKTSIEELERLQNLCDSILAKDTGLSRSRIADLRKSEATFGADEAQKWGFIDLVIYDAKA